MSANPAHWGYILTLVSLWWLCMSVLPIKGDYSMASGKETPYGREFQLQRVDSSGYPNDVDSLSMSVYYETPYRCRIIIRDATQDRWEVPSDLRGVSTETPSSAPSSQLYSFEDATRDGRFGFSLERPQSSERLFDTFDSHLYFSHQYIELTTALPPDHFIYGLGERNQSLRLPPNSYTLWNADNFTQPQINMYGSHPAYYRLNPNDGNAHAVVLYNSNQMSIEVTNTSITYRVTGGILDFYFLLGPTPADVANQYTELVGRPYLPPLWALGFHTCRWGFENVSYTKEVVEGYMDAHMPLDVVWNDIDYMNFYFGFSFDPNRFNTADLKAFNDFLTSHSMRHIYIVDPGVPALMTLPDSSPYSPYVDGKEGGIFIRHPANDSFLYACVWPSVPVVFPDFTHPNTLSWWTAQIQKWTADVGLPAGLWLDMNEISSFVPGQLPPSFKSCIPFQIDIGGPSWSNITLANVTANIDSAAVGHALSSSPSDIPRPPFLPGGVDPNTKSINISAIQTLSQFYNLHNLFGYFEQRATRLALESLQTDATTGQQTRSFSLSRATFLGSGSQGASWTGDHDGRWDDLAVQIRMFMQMGLHGVTMIGSDLCGLLDLDETKGDGGAEVCARWMQLGAMSPFMRMHYQEWDTSRNREPYTLQEPARSISRQALRLRYSLLLFLNTLSVDAHLTGRPMWRPMWFDFVKDQQTWTLDQQAMIGGDLLFIPVTSPQQQNVTAYIPAGMWYDFHTHAIVSPTPSTPSIVTVSAAYSVNATLPLLMRGGRILVTQTPGMTTAATHLRPLTLHIALNEMGTAEGYVYLEDGVSLTAVDQGDYQRIQFTAAFNVSGDGMVTSPLSGLVNVTGYNSSASGFNVSGYTIERVIIKGVNVGQVMNVTLGGGALGQSCVTLNGTSISTEANATMVTEWTGLMTVTSPLILSFNDGCVLPPLEDETFSLVVPIIILVLMFLSIIAFLVWSRRRKTLLSRQETDVDSAPAQEEEDTAAVPQPQAILSPSVGVDADPNDYAMAAEGGVVRKKRRKKRVKSMTPRAAAQNDLHQPLVDDRQSQTLGVV